MVRAAACTWRNQLTFLSLVLTFVIACTAFAPYSFAKSATTEVPDENNECGADGKAGSVKTSGNEALNGGQKTHHLITVSTDGTVTLTCIPLTEDEKREGKKPLTFYMDRNGDFHLISPGSPQADRIDRLQELLYMSGLPTVATDGSLSRTSMSASDLTANLLGPSGISNAIERAFESPTPPPVVYPVEDVMRSALENAIYGDGGARADDLSKYLAFENDFSRGYAQGVSEYGAVPFPRSNIGPSDILLKDGTIARGGPIPSGPLSIPVPNALPLIMSDPFPQTFGSGPNFDLLSPETAPPPPTQTREPSRAYNALKGYASRFYNWLGNLF